MDKCYNSLGRWISVLHRQFQIFINRKLKPYNLKSSEFIYILALYQIENGMSQDELAKELHLDKSAVARSVTSLEKKGYVVRNQDKENYKIKRVTLTEKANNFHPELRHILDEWDENLSSLTGADVYDATVDSIYSMVTGILEKDNKRSK